MTTQLIPIQTYRIIAHEAEEGGYWAEVVGLPGCVSQGETMEEVQQNIREAIEAVLQPQAKIGPIELHIEPKFAPSTDTWLFIADTVTGVVKSVSEANKTWTAAG